MKKDRTEYGEKEVKVGGGIGPEDILYLPLYLWTFYGRRFSGHG